MRVGVCLFALTMLAGSAQHQKEPHQHPEAAKVKNPIPADAASIEAGKTLYAEQCAACHGVAGKGDGEMAPFTGEPPPSDLTDAAWKHGSTDGEIFAVIRDGVDDTGMQGFGADLKPNDMWNLVNYIRTFGPKPAH